MPDGKRQARRGELLAQRAALDADAPGAASGWADQALMRDPGQPEARVAKATLLIVARDAQGALALLDDLLAARPRDGRALSAAAMAHMVAGRLPVARDLFERAVEAMPGHIGTWLGLGWCLLFLDEPAAARAAFERALALDENFGESHGALAVVDAREGRLDQARTRIRRARGLDPRGLAAAYAQALLDGEALDARRFLMVADRALSAHRAPDGRPLSEVVLARR